MEPPTLHVTIPDIDLWTFLFERKDEISASNAALFTDASTGRNYTYSSVRECALVFAQLLRDRWDWHKGDVVVTQAMNSIDLPAVIWGTLAVGGVICPMNPQSSISDLSHTLQDTGARLIIADSSHKDSASIAATNAGIPSDCVLDLAEVAADLAVQSLQGVFQPATICPSTDLAFLVYSSGTTGRPKGVMLSHRNMVANILQSASVAGEMLGAHGRVLAMLPFFHIYGITCLLGLPLYLGLPIVVMPRFQLDGFCAAVERHQITSAFVVPPILRALHLNLETVRQYRLDSLRVMVSGAAPLEVRLIQAVQSELDVPIVQGFGMSECAPCTHWQTLDESQRYPGSVGRLLPNMTARIVPVPDINGPPGVGELWIKGPNVFLGYLHHDQASGEVFSEDGYYKTGDVGYEDKNGNFYVTDRIKEMIKCNGFQIAPGELESLISQCPLVADVAVVGISRPAEGTELPRAYVVLRDGGAAAGQTSAKAIIEFVERQVVSYKRLKGGVSFISQIPRSAAGKTLRRELRALSTVVY
ncbi:acetyl-CoA synthetase-like protein [Aspergillus floccosus]